MKFVRAITTDLSVGDTLIMISALDYLIADTERHEIDRAHAEKLRQKIITEVERQGVEVVDGFGD